MRGWGGARGEGAAADFRGVARDPASTRASERIDIASEVAPDVVLARIAAEAEWRTDDEGPAFPYDPGARRVNVRIQGIRFTMSMNAS